MIAAIAIIILVAVPGSDILLNKYRMKHASGSIISGLQLARSEASVRGSSVVLCPSSNGHTCRKDANWNHGWIVFSDGNGNGTVQEIELIRTFKAPSQEIAITAIGAVEKMAAFTAMGLRPDKQEISGRFQICLKQSDAPATAVEIDAEGWVLQVPNTNPSCSAV